MNLQKIQKEKGISPIIATLLLILIAIAAGVIVYAYVVGFIGSQSPSAPQVGTDQLSVNGVQYNLSATTLTVYIQNIGTNSLNVTAAYLYFANGTLTQQISYTSFTTPAGKQLQIAAGTTGTLADTGVTLASGQTYYLRVTTLTGSSATSSNFKT